MFKAISAELFTAKCHKIRAQCLSALAQTPEKLQGFRTPINNPLEHTPGNLGQYYRISPEVRKQLFSHGGIPKSYYIQAKTFAETCIMIREPTLDIINCIKTIDLNSPAVRFVLYGKKGSGKSLALANLLHYGASDGFLLVHVPWVGRWMRYCKEYSNSSTKEGCVDVNLDAADWLVHFKTQNAILLQQPDLKTSVDYIWSKREATPAGSSLFELLEHGVSRVKYASDCVIALCKEIKKLSKEGKCKTLVAIDGFNAFFYPNTRVFTEKREMVPPWRVTVTEAFTDITKNDWNNGICVLTVDEIAMKEEDQKSHLPRYLLGKNGFEHLDPFVPIEVTSYNSKELTSCMDYYRERKWIQPIEGQDDELAFLSASNPYKLMQLCNAL